MTWQLCLPQMYLSGYRGIAISSIIFQIHISTHELRRLILHPSDKVSSDMMDVPPVICVGRQSEAVMNGLLIQVTFITF
jgi:hypothetical protein